MSAKSKQLSCSEARLARAFFFCLICRNWPNQSKAILEKIFRPYLAPHFPACGAYFFVGSYVSWLARLGTPMEILGNRRAIARAIAFECSVTTYPRVAIPILARGFFLCFALASQGSGTTLKPHPHQRRKTSRSTSDFVFAQGSPLRG
jgi:hypothetical protein